MEFHENSSSLELHLWDQQLDEKCYFVTWAQSVENIFEQCTNRQFRNHSRVDQTGDLNEGDYCKCTGILKINSLIYIHPTD